MDQGRPFVGASGQLLERWWAEVGLKRSDFRIDNVLDYQPLAIDKVPRAEMESAIDQLHARLAKLTDPWLIVPTGNYALYALTGKGRVSWHARDGRHPRPGITSHRGSIYEYIDERRRRIKVIPTIHPAATFRTPAYTRCCRADWARIAGDAEFRELRVPSRVHRIKPILGELLDYVAGAVRNARELSVDIETSFRNTYRVEQVELKAGKCQACGHTLKWHQTKYPEVAHAGTCVKLALKRDGGAPCECAAYVPPLGKPRKRIESQEAYLGCVGFAYDVNESFTVPIGETYWGSDADEAKRAVKGLCESNVPKVLQNGLFDAYWLATEGITLRNYHWDTRAMHVVCEPDDVAHDLAYLGSRYTRQPYWKDEAKDPQELAKYAHNSEALWTYNGIDCCATLEIYQRLREELERRGLMPFYNEHYADMLEPLLALSLHGIAVDKLRQASRLSELGADLKRLEAEIAQAAGTPLIVKSGLSTKRLKTYLYETLRLPKQYAKNAKKEKVVTTNEVAVRRLMQRFPQRLGAVGALILEHRRKKQLATFYKEGRTDADGRMRCLYSPYTDTGRLASATNPKGTGTNLMNQDREARDIFIPDA